MMRILHRLRRDRRGVVTIELAMWSSMFFAVMLGALDFGMWRTYQLRVGSAVEQGAMLLINNRDSVDGAYSNTVKNYVQTAASIPRGTVTALVTCNGPSQSCIRTGRVCACPSATIPVTYATQTCGQACAGRPGVTAGYYATLTASYPFTPIVLPRGLLSRKTLTQSVTVRLQ